MCHSWGSKGRPAHSDAGLMHLEHSSLRSEFTVEELHDQLRDHLIPIHPTTPPLHKDSGLTPNTIRTGREVLIGTPHSALWGVTTAASQGLLVELLDVSVGDIVLATTPGPQNHSGAVTKCRT